MHHRWLLLVLVSLGALALHCSDHDSDEAPKTPVVTPVADAAGDVTEPGRSSGCVPARGPDAPATDDDPLTKKNYWFALDSIEIPVPVTGRKHPGIDLDDSCTCQNDERDGGAPCETPSTARATCDFDNGVDDGVGATLNARFAGAGADVSREGTGQLQTGNGTLLVFLGDYNGRAYDADVKVQFVRSGGLFSDATCNATTGGNRKVVVEDPTELGLPGKQYKPLYDGCDRFSPKPGTTYGAFPDRVPFAAVQGYVTGGKLVAKTATLEFPLAYTDIILTGQTTIATISPEGSGLRLDGIISGRIAFDRLVAFFATTPFGPEQKQLCETAYWPVVNPTLCDARDTMLSPAEQFKGKLCDAATMAGKFSARAAQVSDVEYLRARTVTSCSTATVTCN